VPDYANVLVKVVAIFGVIKRVGYLQLHLHTTSGGSKGGGGAEWAMALTDFWLPPCLSPPVFCLISCSSSLDWHIQQITLSQQNFK